MADEQNDHVIPEEENPDYVLDEDEELIKKERMEHEASIKVDSQMEETERVLKPQEPTCVEDEEYGMDELPLEEKDKLLKEEEKKEAIEDDGAADLTEVMILVPEEIEEFDKILTSMDLSKENMEKAEKTDGKLFRLGKAYVQLTKAVRLNEQLMTDKNLKPAKDVVADKTTRGDEFARFGTIEGETAVINVSARLHKLKRVYLYNSGFHVDLKKLGVNDIRSILETIDESGKEIGRSLGGHFYAMNDIFFVQQVGRILKPIIAGSNLVKFNHGSNLVKFITIEDFSSILGALGEHLFEKGVRYTIECPAQNCDYSEKVKLDIRDTKQIDWDKMPKAAIERLMSEDAFTPKDFFEYQKLIGAYDSFNVTPEAVLHLKTPTIFTFVKHGIRLMATMIKALYSTDTEPSEQQIFDYRMLNYYKNFIPWIEKVVFYKPDGKPDFQTSEVAALEELLEPSVWENSEERKRFHDYFSKSRIVHHGVLGNTCPKCGKAPNPKTNGFIPLDMHSFFYNLSAFHNLKSLGS